MDENLSGTHTQEIYNEVDKNNLQKLCRKYGKYKNIKNKESGF